MNPVIDAAVTAERLRRAAEALSGEANAYIILHVDNDTVEQLAIELGTEAWEHVVVDQVPPQVRSAAQARHLGTLIQVYGERPATREDANLQGWCFEDGRSASSEEVAVAVGGTVIADLGVM